MKSIFSCIPRKKNKCKKHIIKANDENCVIYTKPFEANNIHVESQEISKLPEDVIDSISEMKEIIEIKENGKIESQIIDSEDEQKKISLIRLNNVLLRIENVSNILHRKYSSYCLYDVIEQFELLYNNELENYIVECEKLDFSFKMQSQLVRQLFSYHNTTLKMITTKSFTNLEKIVDGFRKVIIEINEICLDDQSCKELHKLIADSVLLIGWLCVLDKPDKFVSNNMDGFLISVTRLLNNSRFKKYSDWIKSWSIVLKRFSLIITKHFQAALLWKLDGPIPMDILKCLIECNYSQNEGVYLQINGKSKEKKIQTIAANDISCEAMTNLMNDLRSGRQKTRLKPIRIESEVTSESTELISNSSNDKHVPEVIDIVESKKLLTYHSDQQLWILEDGCDENFIEIPNKNPKSSILIKNCHNCSIQIEGVTLSISIENSSTVNIIIDEVIDLFQAVDSSLIEFQVFRKIGKINLKNVNGLRLFVPCHFLDQIELNHSKSAKLELFVSKTEDIGLELDDFNLLSIETSCRNKIHEGKMFSELF